MTKARGVEILRDEEFIAKLNGLNDAGFGTTVRIGKLWRFPWRFELEVSKFPRNAFIDPDEKKKNDELVDAQLAAFEKINGGRVKRKIAVEVPDPEAISKVIQP